MIEVLGRGFRRNGSGLVLRLDAVERTVLADLLGQLVELVEPEPQQSSDDPWVQMLGIADEAIRPEDPALLRLLPDAYRDDRTAASDFRRFTEQSLREQKATRAKTALATLTRADAKGRVQMTRDEGQDWLLAVNDIRLTLGTRLGITQEGEDSGDSDRPAVYDWLTWLQSTLIDTMMPKGSPLR